MSPSGVGVACQHQVWMWSVTNTWECHRQVWECHHVWSVTIRCGCGCGQSPRSPATAPATTQVLQQPLPVFIMIPAVVVGVSDQYTLQARRSRQELPLSWPVTMRLSRCEAMQITDSIGSRRKLHVIGEIPQNIPSGVCSNNYRNKTHIF